MNFKWFRNVKKLHRRYTWPSGELYQALRPLARRVTLRYWLESARVALLWGLAAAGSVLVLLRLYPAVSPLAALVAGGTAALAVASLYFYRRPDALAVVRVVDEFGLNGEAITAFRLLETGAGDSWSREALNKGMAACARFARSEQARYPTVPRWRPWRDLALLAAVLLVLPVVPDYLGSYWAERKVEQQTMQAAAREAHLAIEQIKDLKVNGEDILPEEVRKKLSDLPRAVAQAGNRNEAAAKLERARWELDGARAVIDPSARRDIQRLAEAWGSVDGREWQDMAQALRSGEEEAIQKTMQELVQKMQENGNEPNLELAAAMFASAGMVENPALRKSLRDTAGAALSNGSAAGQPGTGSNSGRGDQTLAAAANSLAGTLAGAAATASAGGALGSASSTLASVARSLSGSGAAGAGTQMAGNTAGTGEDGGSNSAGNTAGAAGTALGGTNSSGAHGPGET